MSKHVLVASVMGLLILSVPVSADPNGPLAHYTFDAGNFDDVSGNGYHGTAMGDARIVDGVLSLDGNGDYVQTTLLEPLKTADSFTMAAWIKNTWHDGLGQHIIWIGNASGNGYGHHQEAHLSRNFYTSSSYNNPYRDNIVFNFGDGNNHEGKVVNIIAEENFDGIDEWHHVAAVVSIDPNEDPVNPDDPDDPNNFITSGALYVDGIWQTPADHGWPSILTVNHAVARNEWDVELRIGISGATDRRGFNGMMDDVEIYDRALSADEIQSVMRKNMQRAWAPSPADGQIVDIPDASQLAWSPGDGAVAHDVYFGTDLDAVATAQSDNTELYLGRQEETTLALPITPEWGQSFYWRIDEVNDVDPDNPEMGQVWSFSVITFIIDDFEDYNDFESDTVWNTWSDGYGIPGNGSSAGYPDPDFVAGEHYVETKIVFRGEQSMPVFYENSVGLSEVTKNIDTDSDWTAFSSLVVWYHGVKENAAEPMFIALDSDAIVVNEDPDAALVAEWTRWDISLSAFSDQGVDLSNVGSITIGFGDKTNPVAGGEGHVFFDDVGLSVVAIE